MSDQGDIRIAFSVPSVFCNYLNVTIATPGILRIAFGEANAGVVIRMNAAVSIQMSLAEDLIDMVRRIIDEHAAQMHR